MVTEKVKLLVIVGQTATGKTELAIKLAKKFGGEIICADSRTVYKVMDIGTAKPTSEERKIVPHHLLDVVKPDEKFTVADYKVLADNAIRDIRSRGKLPILVGGSGLYVDSVIFDYQFRPKPKEEIRDMYNNMDTEELQKEIYNRGLEMPTNSQNRRHLIRALETNGEISKKRRLTEDAFVIGLSADKSTLSTRINSRINNMLKSGLIDETKKLAEKYGWDNESTRAPAYTSMGKYLSGELNIEEAKTLFAKLDMALAKRQLTWFKRNKSIHWVNTQTEAVGLVTTLMNK